MMLRSSFKGTRALALTLLMLALGVVACASGKGSAQEVSVGKAVQATRQATGPAYTLFESGPVRPLCLSPSGSRLFAVNIPDSRLEIYDVTGSGLRHLQSVPVGLEPVAVAAASDDEVWVVNHLSDSVSIVDVRPAQKARVVRTLLVGDEPRDIVFAGHDRDRAFITTAHRGQNNPSDPQLQTPSVGRADVWVFDSKNLGAAARGAPLSVITLFSDTPRALAVSPDGARVYAAAFLSGNRTTTLSALLVFPQPLPPPTTNFQLIPQPPTGLIVQNNGQHWVDELGRVWDDQVKFSLPDKDVFVLDALASPPRQVAGPSGFVSGVGTVLFNMAVNPVSGKLYVSNTEALNASRFEGPGVFAGHTVRGHFAESRITVVANGQVTPRHLNKHINYASCCAPVPNAENAKSLASPEGMAISKDGAKLYVAAFMSSKIGVFDTAALENDSFVPSTANQIPVTGGGPSGPVLDEHRKRLYVLTRFDDSISIIDTQSRSEVGHVAMHNPEPPSVLAGRRVFYDASLTSSHGDSSCASCHIGGDFDGLAWDLGNPDGTTLTNPGPINGDPLQNPDFVPMKGPMTTQSLRGMANHGPMHWRGDRTGGNDAPSAQPNSGTFDEDAAFKKFIVAFEGLLGRSAPINPTEMQAFTDFILQVTYPPNPIRALDNSLTSDQQVGRDFFMNNVSGFQGRTCNECHVLDPQGNAEFGVTRPGFFGTDGRYSFEAQPQILKIPHLRNLYQKVGMFGVPSIPLIHVGSDEFLGDQVRGFGFLHDGSVPTTFDFNAGLVFDVTGENPGGFPLGTAGDQLRHQVADFMLAFDSNMAPIVGQQITLQRHTDSWSGSRISLMRMRADAGECELVAKGNVHGHEVGFLYVGNGFFEQNVSGRPNLTDAQVRAIANKPNQELTYTCVPPGSGSRIAIDRDQDGYLDGDEEASGSDPADPHSTPS
jgi:DNA-binding beta-propeller fold protein YncE